jgi:hypothetical protein
MARRGGWIILLTPLIGCTTVDPGSNPSIPLQVFDQDFYYCHVEPELIVAKSCGPGDTAQDGSNNCHFNPASVSAMALIEHPAIDCGGGDHPVDRTQIGPGSAAQGDFQAVSFEMSKDYRSAPLLVRPSGRYHPRSIFDINDPQVNQLLATWASK